MVGGGDGTTTRDVPLSELGLSAQAGAGGSGGGLPGANLPSSETLGQVSPLSDSATSNAMTPNTGGGPGAHGAPGTPGTPGMPMGGGMGGMGAGDEKGNGERVRSVLVDAAEESERRNVHPLTEQELRDHVARDGLFPDEHARALLDVT
ncbi:hypothetical protein [Streptomyces sp. NPDC006415]|uniref:hypothetical protein n=1 Tax=Streptomyces sp. NPDC006415 TaxID=3155351 RepID=UPI0033BE56F9